MGWIPIFMMLLAQHWSEAMDKIAKPMKFVAVKKFEDGGESVMEYFETKELCLDWICQQRQPTKKDSWHWCVGEYA